MRNRKRFRRPLRRESFSRPLPGVCASRASPQHCTMPRSHGGVRSGSSQVLPLHRIEIETREGASGKAESKGGWHCREDGRTDGGREACPMSVANNKIITVQKMGDATRRLRLKDGDGRDEGGRRPLPPIFKFHLRPRLFRPSSRPDRASSPAASARSFILFYWGAIDDVFQGRNLWRRGEEVKKSLFGCPQIGRTVFSILHWAMLIGRQRMLPYIGPVLEVEWVAPAP